MNLIKIETFVDAMMAVFETADKIEAEKSPKKVMRELKRLRDSLNAADLDAFKIVDEHPTKENA